MIVNNNFSQFKTYENFIKVSNTKRVENNKAKYIKPLIGSAAGVALGFAASKKINLESKSHILNELTHLLLMAGGANVGSVLTTSIGKNKEEVKKKVNEGLFQMMNTTIPMLLVGCANAVCNKTIGNKKPLLRVLTSCFAMFSGAYLATHIANSLKDEGEAKRKYTIKDTVANVDDIVATFSIGFEEQAKRLALDTRLMPFIYAYCGMRAGAKE